ncbi:MAG: hypothetical protein ABGY96_11235 [bacterium]|nr:hypothetical protein [Gammaproteobacteria bacterium]
MAYLIVFVGAVFMALGLFITIRPDVSFELIRKYAMSMQFKVINVLLGLMIGILFISFAEESKYPAVFTIIGMIAIVKGMVRGLIGLSDFQDLVSWYLKAIRPFARAMGLLVVGFGGFIIHAAQ